MQSRNPKVLITLREDGKNGGPYISHKNILNSSLSEKYELIPFYNPNARKMRNFKVFFKVVRDIKKIKPDLAHIAGLQIEGFLLSLACKLAGVKTVVAVHGSATQAMGISKLQNSIFKILEKVTLLMSKASFGVSDYVSSWNICKNAKNYYGTIYNIVNIYENAPSKPYIREELGIAKSDIVVVSTGRITRDKGFDDLWEVIKQLKAYPNIKFVIAGEGDCREEWLTEIKKYGFENNVFLLGYRNDIDAILKESDIFIICTKHETLCISLLEAASNSLPLIASNVGGIPEIIEKGENGFLAEVGDIGGFKSAVLKLAGNKELRNQMGAKAKLKVDTVFNENDIVAKLDNIYKCVIGGKNGKRKS